MKNMSIMLLFLGILVTSCRGIYSCPTYSYKYRDVGSDSILSGYDNLIYLPGDTVIFYPEGREIVIVSITINNTTLEAYNLLKNKK